MNTLTFKIPARHVSSRDSQQVMRCHASFHALVLLIQSRTGLSQQKITELIAQHLADKLKFEEVEGINEVTIE